MIRKVNLFLAKLLIVLSIVLIVSGVCVQFNFFSVLHPVDDVTVLNGSSGNDISITTTDSGDVNNSSSTSVPTTTPDVILPADDNSTSGSTVAVNPSGSGELTVEQTNDKMRRIIEKTYDITIKYGNETSGYKVGGMSTTVISDSADCQTALINLNKNLALYPSGFFRELKGKGFPLTFYLIKNFSKATVTGVTDSASKDVIIAIATDYDFADTFNHEVYHYVERYIFSMGFKFTSWNSLNPRGFHYGTINNNYSYTETFSEDAFFVNGYAQTDDEEDRASTFEYMMKDNKASCLNEGKTVWAKARAMSEPMDYFLNSVSPDYTEYWERFIY